MCRLTHDWLGRSALLSPRAAISTCRTSPSIEVAVDVDVADLVVGLQVLQRRSTCRWMTSGSHRRALSIVPLLLSTSVLRLGLRERPRTREVELVGAAPGRARTRRAWRGCCGRCTALRLELVRVDPELLDRRRVDRADHERHERPQPDRDDRQHPAAPPDVPEEQRGGDDRDEDQQVERGELRLRRRCSSRPRPRPGSRSSSSKRPK